MATFVHLTLEKYLKPILRNGITRRVKRKNGGEGVYAFPVTKNYYASHQWLRELKRHHAGPMVAVYFRIPDETIVTIGRYNQEKNRVTAAEAISIAMQCSDLAGYEVIVPRKIAKDEIRQHRRVSQVVGWRYYPGAHGRKPCGCDYCQRGQIGARKLRERYQKEMSS